ncbi:MAG: HAMP domain-containing sensor histidine kinase [Patescibacteria group bacterium]
MYDDFFKVRAKLILVYTATVSVLIAGYSFILYDILLSDFADSLQDRVFALNPEVRNMIVKRTGDIIQGRIMIIDIAILSVIVLLSFFLTNKTLGPIRENIQKQKRFVADASHEMRTPIAVIISGLEVVLRNKDLNVESARETLVETLAEMKEFSKLSTHLLDISRYDAGIQVDFNNVDITEVIESAVQKTKLLAADKKIELTSSFEEQRGIVMGNKIELYRLFYNIVHNAIKYTQADGKIIVHGERKNKKYVATITDTGIGMDKETISKIFDPFFQGDKSRSSGGAGLGLTLAKRIVENHKGSLQIQSKIGDGTKISISFPLAS